jgi:hypothetical protein
VLSQVCLTITLTGPFSCAQSLASPAPARCRPTADWLLWCRDDGRATILFHSFHSHDCLRRSLQIFRLLLPFDSIMLLYPEGFLALLAGQNASTGWTAVRVSLPEGGRDATLFSLLTCRRIKSAQVVIDLTLSDDEDVSYVQPRFPHPSAHTASLLVEIPSTRHGLPMFTTSADRKSEKRDGASGMNYAENHLPNGFGPLAAAPDFMQPRSGSRSSGPSNNRNHASANLENLSNKRVNARSPRNRANTAKRRKTTHDGVHLGRRGRGATSVSLGARLSPSSGLRRTHQLVDPALSHPTAQPRTVITGANRLQSSYGSSRSPEGLIQDSIALDNPDNHSMAILLQVFELIKQALQPYHGDLSSTDRKEITTKVREQENES